jgi:hypothetical protein
MDTNKILGCICIFILIIVIVGFINKPIYTVPITKVTVRRAPNSQSYTGPNYAGHYNPYKAQFYN